MNVSFLRISVKTPSSKIAFQVIKIRKQIGNNIMEDKNAGMQLCWETSLIG